MEILVPIIHGPVGILLAIGVFVYMAHQTRRRQAEVQKEVQLALLDKFKSAEEMTQFLSTEQGVQFVDGLTALPQKDPRQRTVWMAVGGSVMTSLALGFAALYLFIAKDQLLVPAIICGALGVGFLAAAVLSHSISKKLGLTKER